MSFSPQQIRYMTSKSDATTRLADAVAGLATAITEMIEVKVREYAAAAQESGAVHAGIVKPSWTEG